jgi:hypothetical protein
MREHDFVFVSNVRTCGITAGIARVTKLTGNGSSQEASIVFDNGEKGQYYLAHLYQNSECHRRRAVFMKERAAKIGTKGKQ